MLNLKDRAQDTSTSTVLLPILVPKVLGSVLGYGLLGRSQQWASSTDVYCAPITGLTANHGAFSVMFFLRYLTAQSLISFRHLFIFLLLRKAFHVHSIYTLTYTLHTSFPYVIFYHHLA